jgi:hypothetical protein
LIVVPFTIKYKSKCGIWRIGQLNKFVVIPSERKGPSAEPRNLGIYLCVENSYHVKNAPKRIVYGWDYDRIYLACDTQLKLIIPRGYIWKVIIETERY